MKCRHRSPTDREEAAGAAGLRSRAHVLASRRLGPPAEPQDSTRGPEARETWYQVRKKIGDIRSTLPQGVVGPVFNDEFGDVFSAVYMLTGNGASLADLKRYAEQLRQSLLRVPDVTKIDLVGDMKERSSSSSATRSSPPSGSRRSSSSTACRSRTRWHRPAASRRRAIALPCA